MRLALSPSRRSLLAVLPFVAACASTGAPAHAPNLAERFVAIRDSLGAGTAVDRGDGPQIRLSVIPPVTSIQFVDATFRVSENAYAFVAVLDLDRRIRVLYPESPADAGLARADERYRLTRFFAGFGGTSLGQSSRYRLASFNAAFSRTTPYEGGGVIIAVASDRPLQFERLGDAEGNWDENALEDFLMNTTPSLGVHAIGRALTVTGQEFTSDIASIAGAGVSGSLAFYASRCLNSQYGFNAYDDYGYGDYRGGWGQTGYALPRVQIGRFTIGERTFIRYAQTDECGVVTYRDIPAIELPKAADTSTARIASSAFRIPVRAEQGETMESPWLHPRGVDGDGWHRVAGPAAIRPHGALDTHGLMIVDRPAVRDEPKMQPIERVQPRPAEPIAHAAPVRPVTSAGQSAPQPAAQPQSPQ